MENTILHVNNFFLPYIAGPAKHIIDVIDNTFSNNQHEIVSFDLNDSLSDVDTYSGVPHRRFLTVSQDEIHRYLGLGLKHCLILNEFVQFVRDKKPLCIALYFVGWLPYFIRMALPEINTVFMPFGYSAGDYQHLYRSRRFKIALCGDGCFDEYLKAGAHVKQIHIIERPINCQVYQPLNVERDPFGLLMVGRFHPMKRIPALIKTLTPVFQNFPKLHLHIVADTNVSRFSGAMREELNKVLEIISKNNLSDRVFLRGKRVGLELLAEYSEASIHILPSTHDRRATVTQEAITMGMQCINTCKKSYDWPEYTEDGRRLIHYVDKIEDIVPVLRHMLENPDQYHSNRDYAIEHWSWEKWAPEYEKLFTKW